jgi:hypothetical protein
MPRRSRYIKLMITSQAATVTNYQSSSKANIAATVRRLIEEGGERFWRVSDFEAMPVLAVSQALSRLTKSGILQRTSKGLYYHSRTTALGRSQPSESEVDRRSFGENIRPAGLTAANLLGFTTQNPIRSEYATASNNASKRALSQSRVYTRRPESWKLLSDEDAAILDFLRSRGNHSELSDDDTIARLLSLMRAPGRFERFVAVAADEPPRVRAMLGAIGAELAAPAELNTALRQRINKLSRFDFGRLRVLPTALEWQAK